MTTFDITYYARVEAKVEASSLAEAETLLRDAHGAKPPALYINDDDVIYDYFITRVEETA